LLADKAGFSSLTDAFLLADSEEKFKLFVFHEKAPLYNPEL